MVSFGNQSILNIRVMEVRARFLKNIYLSRDLEPF